MANFVNPDPHKKGYRFVPTKRMTAVFASPAELPEVRNDLRSAGFADKDIEIFVGKEGAEQFDVSGEHHGPVVSLLRQFQLATADEENLYKEFDEIVRGGGAAIDILTGDDDERKERAAQILKQHHAHDVCYWGRWTVEQF
jgi:hypothetical protein